MPSRGGLLRFTRVPNIVQLGDIPKEQAQIKACNTESLRHYCRKIGIVTTFEATFRTSQWRVPLSAGILR